MRRAGSAASRSDHILGGGREVVVEQPLLVLRRAGEQERLAGGIEPRPTRPSQHLVDLAGRDRGLHADPAFVPARIPNDHAASGEVDAGRERGGRHEDLDRSFPERLLYDPTFRVRERRVVKPHAVREESAQPPHPLRVFVGGVAEFRRPVPSTFPLLGREERADRGDQRLGDLFARATAVDEDERLAAFLDDRSNEARDRLPGGWDLPGREVRECDPTVRVHAQAQRYGTEVAHDVSGAQPVGDLTRVPDRRGERHDLEVGVFPSQTGQTDLERGPPLRIPKKVDLIGDDDAQSVEPGTAASQEAIRLLAGRHEHVKTVELLGGEVEVTGREPYLETQLGEPFELLRLLLSQRAKGNEVKSGAVGPRGPEQRQVGDQGLPAGRGTSQEEALPRHQRVQRGHLRREEGADPVGLQHPTKVRVDREFREGNRGRRLTPSALGGIRSAWAARHGRPSGGSY